ncbi:MAG: glutamine synthetase family protein [bacterium]
MTATPNKGKMQSESDAVILNNIKKKLAEADVVQIFYTDLHGHPMTLRLNPEKIDAFVERGVGFDGSSIPGIGTVDNSDRLLFPILESFRIVEFNGDKLGFFIGKIFVEDGERAKADARAVLENVLERAESEFGFRFLVGPEHEFFLLSSDEFNANIHTDKAGYFHAAPRDKGDVVRRRITDILAKCGVPFEKTHHEVTPSQHEINLECSDPLTVADRTVLFNYVARRVAQECGLHITFMPKPFYGLNRNAFHIHLSMQDKNGVNLFHQTGEPHNLSRYARQFIGGILKYGRETSILMASTYNSYKAYVLGREAPIVVGWGLKNRSSMIRVPYTNTPENTRIELRNPDPAGNVYLQLAAVIGMGLQGIAEGLDCGEPDIGSTYDRRGSVKVWDERYLPKSMFEALVEAERSPFLRNLLGEELYQHYMNLKIREWEEYRTDITDREHKEYLGF